jgi:hypothetical protein
MSGTQHLALFVATGLLLNLAPGQDTLDFTGAVFVGLGVRHRGQPVNRFT